jgi:D-alanyl-D-alanine carboxypeptidase
MKIKTVKRLLTISMSLLMLAFLFSFGVYAAKDINEPELTVNRAAGAVYIYSYECDRVLFCRDQESKRAPASTAKIMAGLVACELYEDKLAESVTVTAEMLEGISGASM